MFVATKDFHFSIGRQHLVKAGLFPLAMFAVGKLVLLEVM